MRGEAEMFRWLALLAFVVASPAVAAGAVVYTFDHSDYDYPDGIAEDSSGLMQRWEIALGDCRDGDKVDIATAVACGDRDTYARLLKGRGLCVTSKEEWVLCKPK